MITTEFTVTKANGNNIKGIAYIPDDGNGKYKTAIFAHGFGGNYKFLMHHGEGFAKAGIVCMFFDFCGGGMESLSDGKMTDMTVMTEASDLEDVIEYCQKQSYVNRDELYLIGESMGGFVASYVAGKHSELVKALCLWYPAFVIPDDSRKRFEVGDNTCFGTKLSPDFNEVAMNIDIYSQIGNYEGPVQIIHGDADPIVPIEYSNRAIATYRNASLEVIKGAGHGFDGEDSVHAREVSIDFIKVSHNVLNE